MDDKRFERELKHKEVLQKQADQGATKESEQAPSATYDAFMRMQTGQETRTIADKINDPSRVSWEQFRKVLHHVCACVRVCGRESGGQPGRKVLAKTHKTLTFLASGWTGTLLPSSSSAWQKKCPKMGAGVPHRCAMWCHVYFRSFLTSFFVENDHCCLLFVFCLCYVRPRKSPSTQEREPFLWYVPL